MTKRQKELMKLRLHNEKLLLKELERIYQEASKQIDAYIEKLMREYEITGLQSKIYQKKFQQALKRNIDKTLGRIRSGVFKSIDDYRKNCYEDGFIGAMYDMQGQGVPLIIPIDPEQMVRAIELDSRLSTKLYKKLGIDVNLLKKAVREEISIGLASGKTYDFLAARINARMNIGRYKSMRIARTEGQRIVNEATYHAQLKAKAKGADVVKQWCGILDGKIRPSHAELHHQIKELEEYFVVNGHQALCPSGFGIPSEDINCRCSLLQRARWAIDEKGDGFIEAKNFNEFKNKYKQEENNA